MQYLTLLILSLLGSVAGLVGGVVFLVKKNWADALSKYSVSFAAGVLLSVSLVHLIPEAVHEGGENMYFVVLFAFLGSFFFEQFFVSLHHHEGKAHTTKKTAVPLVLFGDTIHNFIDGVAIAAAYMTDPVFGLLITAATFLHETPHEIGDFGILVRAGWGRAKTFTANLISALFTVPGAFLTFFLADKVEGLVGVLLSVSAGVFLYLGASDFLPEVGEGSSKRATKELVLFSLGVAVMLVFAVLLPEH